MAEGDDMARVRPKDRGTGNRGTGNRLTRDTPHGPKVDEAAMSQALVDLRDRYRADVGGLIKLGERLQKEFRAAGKYLSLVRRTAARELLRVYRALQDLESALPRGPGGILMQRIPFKPKSVPWPNSPRSLASVAPFSSENVKEWVVAAQESGPPIPARTPAKIPTGAPNVIKKTDDSFFTALLIKVPGMNLALRAGQTVLLARVLRVMSHQKLTGQAATHIAAALDVWKHLVLDYGDTKEHKVKVLDSLEIGHEYSVKLKKEFLTEAQKLTSVPLDTSQRLTLPVNEWSREYRPDNSEDERAWYAVLRAKGKNRDRNSGYRPGEIVNSDGIVFIGPEVGDSMYLAPNGKLYLIHQAVLHDQQLEAVRLGVVDSAGGVVLGWTVVVLGAAALAAPAAVGVASEALGAGLLGSGAAGGASLTALYESVLYSRWALWLGANWHLLLAEGSFYLGLGNFVYTFNPRQFVQDFKRDPFAAVIDLAQQLASIGHDWGEARMAGMSGGSPARSRGRVPVDETPTPLPLASRPTTVAIDPGESTPVTNNPPRNDTLRRMTANALVKDAKPDNDNRLTSIGSQEDLIANESAPPVVFRRTGTDDAPIDDTTAGVTIASRKITDKSTAPTAGKVTPATRSGRGGGGGLGRGGGSGKGGGPDGGDDAAKARGTSRSKDAQANDNDRAIGSGRFTRRSPRPWTSVDPPRPLQYANRSATLRERLRFLKQTDQALPGTNKVRTDLRTQLGIRQRTQLDKWIDGLDNGTMTENDILNPNRGATQATTGALGQPSNAARGMTVDSLEDTINSALSENYRYQMALKTGMHVVSVGVSNNVGDQAADFQALQAGRARAYPFTIQANDGQLVQVDDFDFDSGQLIESKSISNMVPRGTSPDEAIHRYRQQMTKQAYAARDNDAPKPVRWDVPPEVHQDVVDKAWGGLPKDVRDWIVIGPPTAPIRVTPTEPPPPRRTKPRSP
jgi:hypothetical protein